MMLSRAAASAAGGSTNVPRSSGPRWRSVAIICSRRPPSGGQPSNYTNPAIPHISYSRGAPPPRADALAPSRSGVSRTERRHGAPPPLALTRRPGFAGLPSGGPPQRAQPRVGDPGASLGPQALYSRGAYLEENVANTFLFKWGVSLSGAVLRIRIIRNRTTPLHILGRVGQTRSTLDDARVDLSLSKSRGVNRSRVFGTEPHTATSARVSTTEIRRTPTHCQTPWSGGPSARLRAVRRQAKGSTRGANHLTRPQSCGRVRGHALERTLLAPRVARTAGGALTDRRSTARLGSRPRPPHREGGITD